MEIGSQNDITRYILFDSISNASNPGDVIMSCEGLTGEITTPFGAMSVVEKNDAIIALHWKAPEKSQTSPLLKECGKQITAYFAGNLKIFDLPLKPKGDEFQQAVCRLMLDIPYGETTTYGEIAEKLDTYGQPVGKACGGNSIPIIIPCHRVLAVNGIGGYSGDGGIERKIELLKLEGGFPFLL